MDKNKKILKNSHKAIITIVLYLLYQSNFLINLINDLIIKLSDEKLSLLKLNRNLKLTIFAISDFIYILIILFMFKDEIKNGLKDIKKNFSKLFNISVLCWLIGCVVMSLSSFIISFILKEDVSKNEEMIRESIKLAPIYMLLTCSVIAPVFEEMVFRKSLNIFVKNRNVFIILSGILFGLLHIIGNIQSPLDFLYVIPYGSMGCAFAYLLSKTNNITLPIIIHMIHNTVLVIPQIIRGILWTMKRKKEN